MASAIASKYAYDLIVTRYTAIEAINGCGAYGRFRHTRKQRTVSATASKRTPIRYAPWWLNLTPSIDGTPDHDRMALATGGKNYDAVGNAPRRVQNGCTVVADGCRTSSTPVWCGSRSRSRTAYGA